MKAEELGDLRKRAEREDFTETYQADTRGGLTPVKTPYYMLLLPSDFRSALTLAQQEARAAALEEAAELRTLLFLRHGCSGPALYGDDGERSCSACGIDFRRMSPDEIGERLRERTEGK